jgi:type III pantothenate kinase
MKLLFDIGNTRIKWAYDTDTELLHAGEALHRGRSDDVRQIVAGLEQEPEEIWVVNVAGAEYATALTDAALTRFGVTPRFVKTTRRCGEVVNGYDDVSQHGVDRWAAVVGAWNLYRSDVCVVDAGTAMTIDLVRADGRHEGGFILPGIQLMADALHRDTSDIEAFSGQGKALEGGRWCGTDTLSAVQLGAVFALRATVTEAVRRLGGQPAVVFTGGDAHALIPLPDCEPDIRPMLVIEGLRQLAAMQQ